MAATIGIESNSGNRLTERESRRYSRHLVIPEVGIQGQNRLKEARVLVVGAGGLGSPVSMYLAAVGVGKLGLVEFDDVDESNLQRQVLYGESDIGKPKLEVALARLREINPLIELVPHAERIDASNAMALLAGYDIVVDGDVNEGAAWYYAAPLEAAENIRDHVAFWRGVDVER